MRTLSCQRCFEVFIDWSQREKLFYFLLAPHGQFFLLAVCRRVSTFYIAMKKANRKGNEDKELRDIQSGIPSFTGWKTAEGCRSEYHGIDLLKGCRYLAHSRFALPLRRKML